MSNKQIITIAACSKTLIKHNRFKLGIIFYKKYVWKVVEDVSLNKPNSI